MRERGPTPQDDPDAATSATPIDWLFATQWYGMKLGLDSMLRLLLRLDQPQHGLTFLHVAGTNGKGSTCAFAESLLRSSGYKTGLFTSPHLVDFRERIQINRHHIAESTLDRHLDRIRTLVDRWKPHPTFFEIAFAAALLHFQENACERVVVEVGMGGRLDSTNIITPHVSVIMPVDYDHKKVLGNKLREIASEKAGIIKPKIPLILAPQRPSAAQVIRRTARLRQAPVTEIQTPWHGPVGLPGEFQRWNAAAAIAAARICGADPDPSLTQTALSHTHWPARFQRIDNNRLIIDGAHNPAAARVLVTTWQEQFPNEKAAILFSAMKDKDWTETIDLLAPIVDEWIFTQLKSARALTPDDLEWASNRVRQKGTSAQIIADPATALTTLRARNPQTSPRILIAGSLYLAGEILSLLQNTHFVPSEQ